MVTARPWRKHGELVDLPSAVIGAGVRAGLIPTERCVALLAAVRDGRLVARPSFFQLQPVRKARAAGTPLHLIAHEDVLVFTKPQPTRVADERRAAHDRPPLQCCSSGAGVQSSARSCCWPPRGEIPQLRRGDLRRHRLGARRGLPAARPADRDRRAAGIPVVRVSAGNIRADALDPAHRFASMPLFTLGPNGDAAWPGGSAPPSTRSDRSR